MVYQIFVRSFFDGDSTSDGVGDLKGLIQKLDYLNDGDPTTDTDLEVGILWLMPTFPTKSYHGYDVTDYRAVNPAYGTLSDMEELIEQAHRRGLRVILDIPFNHSSNHHSWFQSAVEGEGEFRSYYLMEPDVGPRQQHWHAVTDSSGRRLRYFGLFSPHMPDLNWDNPKVRQEVEEITRFWFELGIDGFRLDAAKHLAGGTFNPTEEDIRRNNKWWGDYSAFVHSIKPDAVLIGEVLGEREMLLKHAYGLSALLDEPFMNEVRAQVVSPRKNFVQDWKSFLAKAESANPAFDSFPYLASHDRNPRLASELWKEIPENAEAAYRLAMCILMSMGRQPMLYNGDEIAQRGWKWDGASDGSNVWDETLREPIPWYADGSGPGQTNWQPKGLEGFLPKFDQPDDGVSVQEQQDNPSSILSLVRALTNLRNRLPVLARGRIGEVLADSAEAMAFERILEDQRCLVMINLTSQTQTYRFYPDWYPRYIAAALLFESDGLSHVWKKSTADPDSIGDSIQVPPFGMTILRPPTLEASPSAPSKCVNLDPAIQSRHQCMHEDDAQHR